MCVYFRGEHPQYIVILMDGFTVIPPFLFVPPIGIRVSKLAGDGRWVDVASVLIGCVLVRGLRRGHSFAVVIIEVYGEWGSICIPCQGPQYLLERAIVAAAAGR